MGNARANSTARRGSSGSERNRPTVAGSRQPSAPRGKNPTPLSPSVSEEIRGALALFQGTQKVEAAAAELGWSRDTYYDRLRSPENVTVGELLLLIARAPDPTFGQRIRHHIAALEAYRAAIEREAGDFYVRASRRDPAQRDLFGGAR